MIQHQIPARSDPVRLVCLAALAATHGLVRLTERYLPAYVVDIGYGPIVVGGLATLGLGVAAIVAERSPASIGDGSSDSESADDESALPRPSLGSITAVLASLCAAAGLLALAGAPTLDGLLGTPLSALGWLAVGLALVGAWHAIGPTRHLWPIDTRVPPSRDGGRDDGRPPPGEARSDRRTDVVVGGLAVAVAAVVATAAVASADAIAAGVSLLAVAGAAVALVAAIALGSTPDRRASSENRRDGGIDPAGADERVALPGGDDRADSLCDEPTPMSGSPLERVRGTVSRLPAGDRPAVVGDALVRLALVGIVPFLVLLVAEYRAIGASIGPLSLAPAGAFALFVLAEATGAILGALSVEALASRVDRRALLAGGLAIPSLVPMALLVVPARPAVVAATFGLLGARTAIEPLRPTLGTDGRSTPVFEFRPPPALRSALRVALVPAPLVAGVLYAIDPVVAFTVATTVGLLGVRELCRAFEFGDGR